jgi:hypothetical protein
LQHGPTLSGGGDHLIGFGQRSRNWFFNQHVNPRLKQGARNFAVRLGWDRKADRIYPTWKCFPVSSPLDLAFRGDLPGRAFVQITNGNKLSQTFSCEIRVDARVLPAKMAHADDSGTKWHGLLIALFGLG